MSDWFDLLAGRLDPLGTRQRSGEHRVTSRATPSAVLALLTSGDRPDLVFTERASTLRNHAGQMSFPGGRIDPGDADAVAAALRETHEEIGLDPSAVGPLGELPPTRLTTAVFNVTPVVATWSGDEPVAVMDTAEVESIHRFAIDDLVSPEHRVVVHHPRGGVGPAFVFGDYMVWGFTAHLVDELVRLGGWERPWPRRVVEIPDRFLRSGL
ncbi:NUDIX hydrolase [Aestuariimicrobium kwangyangense]|uniref:NUDIX hydrolase n=1 Tax=Aestuariimicrobium kwangyangense TaxID=396389 RepID=UPI0003B64C04|nr:CoA pyrophosphatase [Aestuariimicrobium kwangyangense]